MKEEKKNLITATTDAGENLIVGDSNTVEGKAKIIGSNNLLFQDSILMLQDYISGENLDLVSIKNIHGIIQNNSDKSSNCKTLSLIVFCLTFSLISLSPNNEYKYCFLLIPILSFWYIDAIYLSIERMYRDLSKKVLQELQQQIKGDYIDYDISRVFRERYRQVGLFQIMTSRTLIRFYGIQLIAYFTILVFAFKGK